MPLLIINLHFFAHLHSTRINDTSVCGNYSVCGNIPEESYSVCEKHQKEESR